MKNVVKMGICLAMVLCSSQSFANSRFGPVRIVSVSVTDADTLVVNIDSNGEQKHTEQCDVGRETNLIINPDSPYYREMFSIALSAHASGKKISGWVNGCQSFWSYKAPKLKSITILE